MGETYLLGRNKTEKKAIGLAKKHANKNWGFCPQECEDITYTVIPGHKTIEVTIDSYGVGFEEKLTCIIDRKTMKIAQSYSFGKLYKDA